MALTINEAVNHKGKDFTGLYGRIIPQLSEDGATLSGRVKWYYDKPSYLAATTNELSFRDNGYPTEGVISSLPTSFSFDYDRDADGGDLLVLATTDVVAQIIALGVTETNIVNSLTSLSE